MKKACIDAVEEEYGLTSLHYATKNGHKNAARLLLEQGVNVNLADYSGYTSLHHATENGHEGVVELLLEWKTVVNIVDCDGKIPS